MSRYNKLIAAVVGLIAIILGPDVLGLTEQPETIVQSALAVLTAFGVYQLPNEES